jgi:RNA polymerase sigma factor (sigma-70 family)
MPDRQRCLTIRQQHFVNRNLRLVYKQACRYRRRERGRCPLSLEELVSEGSVALCDCARGYTPERGSPSSYCTPAIARRMVDALRRAKLEQRRLPVQPLAREAGGDGPSVPEPTEPPAREVEGVGRHLSCLSDTEWLVIVMRFGLFRVTPHSQEDVAAYLRTDWRRVAKLERAALWKMRMRAMGQPPAREAA